MRSLVDTQMSEMPLRHLGSEDRGLAVGFMRVVSRRVVGLEIQM